MTALWNYAIDLMPDAFLTLYARWAADPSDFQYMSGGSATLTAYAGNLTELALPEKLGAYPLTAIAAGAFQGCGERQQCLFPGRGGDHGGGAAGSVNLTIVAP